MFKSEKIIIGVIMLLPVISLVPIASACTTVLVGKDVSKNGNMLLARNEDNKPGWAKRFVVIDENKNNMGKRNYISKGNGFSIELPEYSQRYTATPDADPKSGQFGESGANQSGVVMSATESTDNNKKIAVADPFVKDGISEDSMLAVVLPYITNAKQGVERLGKIVETKGAAEGDGIIFGDRNEAWYFETGSGHQWAAQRIPNDYCAVIPNEIVLGKLDLRDSNNYLASKNISNFVKKYKLSSYKDKVFTFYKAFGTSGKINSQYDGARQWDAQKLLNPSIKQKLGKDRYNLWIKPEHKLSVVDVQKVLTHHYNGTQYDSYGKWKKNLRPIGVPYTVESHIFEMRENTNRVIEWLAMGSPETSVYIPFFVNNIEHTPEQYNIGNNNVYDNDSATWTYGLTNLLTQVDHENKVKDYIEPVQNKLNNEFQDSIQRTEQQVTNEQGNAQKIQSLYENVNQKNADLAQKAFNSINNKLIQQSTSKDNKIFNNLKQLEDANYAD